jgi:FAD/FMN-containing dehydrogenase
VAGPRHLAHRHRRRTGVKKARGGPVRIRGGGGNFGIVTEFEFLLHPLGPTVLAGLTMFPIDRAPDALPRWPG